MIASLVRDFAVQHCPTAVGWMYSNASMVWAMSHELYREVASKMGMEGKPRRASTASLSVGWAGVRFLSLSVCYWLQSKVNDLFF